MRSILFGLACAPAAAINFTERYEPLIRLANGACNLAEAKTHSTLNCRSTATEAEKKEKKKKRKKKKKTALIEVFLCGCATI